MIELALLEVLKYGETGTVFQGDRSNTGLSMVLLDQLLGYRDWATRLYRQNKKGELTVGGIVTPILAAGGVELSTKPVEPKWLDISNLTRQRFLDRKRLANGYLYKFTHPEVGEARVLLPNPSLTKIRLAENIDFCPPLETLYDPIREHDEQIQEEQSEARMDEEQEPECYYFDDEVPAKSLKEANKRISLLQKWNKWQDKTIKSFKSTMRERTDSINGMKSQINVLQNKASGSPSKNPTQGLNLLRRSGSCSLRPTRSIPMEPARASSFEPRHSVPVEPSS